MQYSYDKTKKVLNLKKHGFDFDDAKQVIEGDKTVTFEDNRFNYGEQRFITIGLWQNALVLIVTSETEKEMRIISMRKAEKHEQTKYHENINR